MSSNIPSLTAELALPRPSTLGEGALWDVEQQTLYWIDIAEHRLFAFNPKSRENRQFDLGEDVGTVVVTENGKLLVALRSGLAVFDPTTETLRRFADPRASEIEGRFNDGKCDPKGRFWVGTMPEGESSAGRGALYRLDPNQNATRMLDGVTCSNGLCWSADAQTFFYVDTPTYEVAAFDYDAESGTIRNRRPVVRLSRAEGAPDGMTIDSEGQLWIALFDGGGVLRVNPKTGERTFRVDVPGGGNVTSCAFGGAKLDELYITTARIGLAPTEAAQLPDAGSLYKARVPFRGVRSPRFGTTP